MSTLGKQPAGIASSDTGRGCDERRSHVHSVQFYEDDDFLLDGLSRFVGAALLSGNSALVVATGSHREGLAQRFSERGLDLTPAISQGRYVSLDASETLSKFMLGGRPDRMLFSRMVGDLIRKLGAAAQTEHPRVAAFGEMVAVLGAEGKWDAAIQLEKLWNELAQTHSFKLHCAYPIHFFSQEKDSEVLQTVCWEHSHAVPTEGYTALATDEEQRRNVILLQQRALALETEIGERKKADQARRESEERLLLAQQIAGIGTFELNVETGVNQWTPELEAIYGLPPGGFSGTRAAWEALIHPDDRGAVARLAEASFAAAGSVQGEWRVVWPDGSLHWIAGKWEVLRDGSGNPLRVTGVNMDITDRKRAEETSLQLAAIVQSANDAIISKDLNGIVTFWNQAAENMFGYPAEEIVGRSILVIVPHELHDQEPRILAKLKAGETIDHFETVRLRKDGERLNVSLTISPIRSQTGTIIGAAKIVRDITQQKKFEASLRTTEKLAAVGRLAATMAHEINNPLEAVTNLMYLATHEPDLPARLKSYLRSADRELRRVSHIARQTLGFYRDNSRSQQFGVAKAVDDVLTIYENRLRLKTLQVEKRIERGLTACTPEGEFKQILSNLIANAIDASKERGRILIRVRAARHLQFGHQGIRVTMADEGAGISSEDKQKLFTPFFTTKTEVGTGLGLWVTRDLIGKRGGSIRFRSRNRTKSGTTMSFFMPLQLPAERGTGQLAPMHQHLRLGTGTGRTPKGRLRNSRIRTV
jgi:PAS domain S-box-containing protein